MLGFAPDELHVRGAGPHVFRRDVAAGQGFHMPSVRAEDRLPVVRVRIADDDALPAPEIQPGDGGLVGHAARQPEHVDQRFEIVLVAPHPSPAQGGAEHRVVDGDDAAIPGIGILPHADLLVAMFGDEFEQSVVQGFRYLRPTRSRAPVQ